MSQARGCPINNNTTRLYSTYIEKASAGAGVEPPTRTDQNIGADTTDGLRVEMCRQQLGARVMQHWQVTYDVICHRQLYVINIINKIMYHNYYWY